MLAAPLDSLRKQASNLQRATAGIAPHRRAVPRSSRACARERGTAALPPGALAVRFDARLVCLQRRDRPGPARRRRTRRPGWSCATCRSSLAAGRVLGVLGRTGSGKTTLTRLLFRLYDPDRRGRPAGRRAICGTSGWTTCAPASAW